MVRDSSRFSPTLSSYRLTALLLWVFLPFCVFGQQVVMERLGDWTNDSIPLHGSLQGMAIYGHRAVLLRHGGQCMIADLKKHRVEHVFQMSGNSSHCNNASFAPKRHLSDQWPLLYVSGCFGDKACYVTHLSDTGSAIVQRIYYDSDCFPVAQDWCVDSEGKKIYAYGGRKGHTLYLKEFHLPNLSSSEVHLTDNDVLRTIPIHCVKVAQGSKIHHGKAYLPDGDEAGHYWLHIVDLASGSEIRSIDLNGIGLEPEGVDVQGRWIYVSFNSPNIEENTIIRFKK